MWCFNDTYPPRIEVDCSHLTPSFPIKIGDVERMLPHGMYLHKMYEKQKFRSVVNLKESNLYLQRKTALAEQNDAIEKHKKKVQLTLMEKKKVVEAPRKKAKKQVPIVVQSAKFLMAEKKEAEKA